MIATALAVESCDLVETLPEIALEHARPIIIKSQYAAANVPPTAAAPSKGSLVT